MRLHDPAASARARAPKTTRNRKAHTMPAPKPRDFRKAPANPNDLRALAADDDAYRQRESAPRRQSIGTVLGKNADALASRLHAERHVVLTNGEMAALATIAEVAIRVPGIVNDDAKPFVVGGLRKLARVLASV